MPLIFRILWYVSAMMNVSRFLLSMHLLSHESCWNWSLTRQLYSRETLVPFLPGLTLLHIIVHWVYFSPFSNTDDIVQIVILNIMPITMSTSTVWNGHIIYVSSRKQFRCLCIATSKQHSVNISQMPWWQRGKLMIRGLVLCPDMSQGIHNKQCSNV